MPHISHVSLSNEEVPEARPFKWYSLQVVFLPYGASRPNPI